MPVTSGHRCTAASAKTKMERDKYAQNRGESGIVGKNEIDNHADTICAGLNWTVLEFTGEYCNVSPFSTEYKPLESVPSYRTVCYCLYLRQYRCNSVANCRSSAMVRRQDVYLAD
jgi:hypothetical protein